MVRAYPSHYDTQEEDLILMMKTPLTPYNNEPEAD